MRTGDSNGTEHTNSSSAQRTGAGARSTAAEPGASVRIVGPADGGEHAFGGGGRRLARGVEHEDAHAGGLEPRDDDRVGATVAREEVGRLGVGGALHAVVLV